ncbi:hypothetical protein B0J14DRAFT_513504 [Halenospora varia]|nr:hypothetical protein B0J14DRAFT_513504 [Halenospora varia]
MFAVLNRYAKFEALRQSEESDSFLEDGQESGDRNLGTHNERSSCRTTLFLTLTFITTILIGALSGRYLILDSDAFCRSRSSQFSPVLANVSLSYHLVQFNDSFLEETLFRQAPSPEVDRAWKSLGIDYRAILVPPDQAETSGLSPTKHVHLRGKYGGGYPSNVEGLHHLHCLNLLRQSLHYNFPYYKALKQEAFINEEPVLRLHVTHCLDILRQQLMCTVDTGVLGRVWWNRDRPAAFPDFNTVHKCKDFEGVRKWAEEHQIPEGERPKDWLEPPGVWK